jgi:hypothetical protein
MAQLQFDWLIQAGLQAAGLSEKQLQDLETAFPGFTDFVDALVQARPLLEQLVPFLNQAGPLFQQAVPLVQTATPIIARLTNDWDKIGPVVQELVSVFVEHDASGKSPTDALVAIQQALHSVRIS